jgi:hypothetical protein
MDRGWMMGRMTGRTDSGGRLHFSSRRPLLYRILVWAPCIMHGCVISTMFGRCFWFFKKTFLFKQLSIPTPPVLHISHSGSLTRRSPPSPRSFTFLTPVLYPIDPPSPNPSHFSLWFFNPSIPSSSSSSGWRYILQNYNYKLHFQNLSIYHIARFFLGEFIFIVSTWNLFFLHILTFFVKRNGPNCQILAFHILELWEQCKVVYI